MGDYFKLYNATREGDFVVIERLLQDERVDPSFEYNRAIKRAACYGHLAVVDRLLQDARVDPSANHNYAVRMAVFHGHLAVVERLLQDARVDPSTLDNCTIRWAVKNGHIAVTDRLFRVPLVYSTVDLPKNQIKHIGMIRSRCTEICIAMQDLNLPALLTLEILDELIPNEIRMWAKWELVTTVKHFHERRQEKKLLLK
jgi:hypothetical protein